MQRSYSVKISSKHLWIHIILFQYFLEQGLKKQKKQLDNQIH